MPLEEVIKIQRAYLDRKAELEVAKAKGGKNWTTEMQDELNEIAVDLVDVNEAVDAKKAETAAKEEDVYLPKPGTENMVHVSMFKGVRFDSKTGKEINKPYVQMFSYAEWLLFEANYANLGYNIVKVLHNPFKK